MTTDPTIPPPDDESQRKHAAKVHNDRMKALADMGKLAFGALVIGGIVRFIVDPTAPSVGAVQLALTFVAAGLIGWGVWVVLGWQRPED